MTIEQAYIKGFVKRASEYGFTEDQAAHLLKTSASMGYEGLDDNNNLVDQEGVLADIKRNLGTLGGTAVGGTMGAATGGGLGILGALGASLRRSGMGGVGGGPVKVNLGKYLMGGGIAGGLGGGLVGAGLDKLTAHGIKHKMMDKKLEKQKIIEEALAARGLQ
jgi:hypothetical protein